jgi:polysaccharide export outer membrane protein
VRLTSAPTHDDNLHGKEGQYVFNHRDVAAGRWAGFALLVLFPADIALAQARVPIAAAPQARAPVAAVASVPVARDYVIGPEDVLDISVWDNTQMSRTVPVRPDGKISLPLLNDVTAGGLTAMELRSQLTTALTPFIPDPIVSVIVRDIHSFKVTVMGEVKQPGRQELRSRSTVLDALALAGGFTEYASRGRIVVLRRRGETTQTLPFAFDKVASGNRAAQVNFDLEPGDIILVP